MGKNSSMSFPIVPILGLIFITLKLMGEITWSWVWVLSPFWIPVVVVLIAFALFYVLFFVLE